MSQFTAMNTLITRRHWVVLAASAVAGCGGGGATTAGLPGTGGTGMYAQGTIAGFGSVIVNSIRFDDTSAVVRLNDVIARKEDLRLGMVAGVQGRRSADVTLGTAEQIDVWTIAQGLISQAQPGQFMVAGMVVQADSATVFDGIANAEALVTGMRVAVWGLQAGADGSRWAATRVALVSDQAFVSSGLVRVVGIQRYLHELLLAGPKAATLADGQAVSVQGPLSDSSLQVDRFKLLDPQALAAPQGEAEIEGLVTATPSASRFMLGNVEVDASSARFSPSALLVAIGQRLEVEGSWQGRVLKAAKVDMKSAQSLETAEIEAPIEQFTSLANFVLRGQRCDATDATISNGTAAGLKVNVKVKVKGTKAGDVLIVTELEFDN
jgi:hypothetical protein